MYGVAAALFVTGAAWLIADALKDGPSGDAWQEISANLLWFTAASPWRC